MKKSSESALIIALLCFVLSNQTNAAIPCIIASVAAYIWLATCFVRLFKE